MADTLRARLIRLAAANPDLRKDILPLLRDEPATHTAGVQNDVLGEAYYEIKVGGFRVSVSPVTQADDDWEYMRGGGVRIDMGRGNYELLSHEQFFRLVGEWENAAAFIKRTPMLGRAASAGDLAKEDADPASHDQNKPETYYGLPPKGIQASKRRA